MTDAEMACRIEKMTGVHITINLIRDACSYREEERSPIAAPKAEAIAQFLTEEMGRKITVADIKGMRVV